MKNRISKLVVLLCVLSLLASGSVPAMASNAMDTGADCSLTVNYNDPDDGSPVVGAGFALFLVAKPGNGAYELTGSFKNMPVELKELDTAAMADMAKTIEALAALYGIAPTESGKTDEKGVYAVDGLEAGLYLLRGYSHSQNGRSYTTSPVLIYLPGYDEAEGQWVYDVEISAKSKVKSEDGGKVERKVLKVWKDDGSERPKEITVHLLRNGETFDTVTLSARNGWSHTWKDLEEDSYWMVAEDVPKGYTVTVAQEGITFVMTNTKPGTPPPSPPPPPDLPQTGQLWWPIPLLAAAGLVMFVTGYVRNRGKRNEN